MNDKSDVIGMFGGMVDFCNATTNLARIIEKIGGVPEDILLIGEKSLWTNHIAEVLALAGRLSRSIKVKVKSTRKTEEIFFCNIAFGDIDLRKAESLSTIAASFSTKPRRLATREELNLVSDQIYPFVKGLQYFTIFGERVPDDQYDYYALQGAKMGTLSRLVSLEDYGDRIFCAYVYQR